MSKKKLSAIYIIKIGQTPSKHLQIKLLNGIKKHTASCTLKNKLQFLKALGSIE